MAGVARNTFAYGVSDRFELGYVQSDEGTCALTSVANLLTRSGRPTTEGDVVRKAANDSTSRRVA
jgi:hypothetical protein